MRRVVPAMLLLTAGCAALGGRKPVIENRFAHYRYGTDEGSIAIAVATSEPSDPNTKVAITSLSDRGQAALIEQTKGKPPLNLKADAPDPATVTLRNSLPRHVVVTVRPTGFLPPGDRVDAVRISLWVSSPGPSRWRISSWTQASNGQTVIDLGKLSSTSASKVTASTGIRIGALPGATVGGESDQTDAREAEIRDTTDFDAAVDNAGVARLDETAGWRQNLAHSVSMDVVLTVPPKDLRLRSLTTTSRLSADDPKRKGTTIPAKPSSVRVLEGAISVPLDYETSPICGMARLDYRIRHIAAARNANTFSEADDRVELRQGTASSAFVLSPPPYSPSFVIRTGGRVLSYRIDNGSPRPFTFGSLDSATAFRNWFREASPKGGRLANAVVGVDVAGTLRVLDRKENADLDPELENPGLTAMSASPDDCPSADALRSSPTDRANGRTPGRRRGRG